MYYVALLLLMAGAASDINYEIAHLQHRLKAVKTSARIIIDGHLDEEAWKEAPIANNFTQAEPKEGERESESTEVRVLYDSSNIYFGIYAYDSKVRHVVINELKKDFSASNADSVDIVLDTFNDRRNAYQFTTNAAGAKWDAQTINEGRDVNANWDAVWYVKTSVQDDGWIAEIAIPFKTLKFRESEEQTWGINFHRSLRSNVRNEDDYWSPIPRIYNIQRISLAGTLEGLEGIRPGSNIRFKPYITSRYSQDDVAGTSNDTGAVGFDAKYGITAGLTWDFTYKTDFSDVEADDQQINLTRFSLFYPEKRDFFLENSGLFQFGVASDRGGGAGATGGGAGGNGGAAGRQNAVTNDMIFFFSRNIGLSPTGTTIPILGGTRLTGRAGRYEIGFLNIEQRQSAISNATNFTVARLRRNILASSDIGVMITNQAVTGSSAYNRVVGSDANFRFGKSTYVNAYIAKAASPAAPDHNLAGRASAEYRDQVWNFRSSYTDIQRNFINEMGYVPRLGLRKYADYAGYTWRPLRVRGWLRSMMPHTQIEYDLNRNGQLDTRYIDFHVPITFQNSASMEIGANPSLELLTQPFKISNAQNIFIPVGRHKFNEYFVRGNTDATRRLSANGRIGIGTFYTGHNKSFVLGGSFRANYRFNTSFSFTRNNINLAEGNFKTNLLSVRVNYSFSTIMFLNALIQYNNDARTWTSNIRFNIIHRPLSDFFLVYNERRDSFSGGLLDRSIIAKVTYMISR